MLLFLIEGPVMVARHEAIVKLRTVPSPSHSYVLCEVLSTTMIYFRIVKDTAEAHKHTCSLVCHWNSKHIERPHCSNMQDLIDDQFDGLILITSYPIIRIMSVLINNNHLQVTSHI